MERVRSREIKEVPSKERAPLEQMEGALQISEHDLDEALLQQPQLYFQVSRQLALTTSLRDAAKQNLAIVEARTDLNIRRAAREKKLDQTEKEVKSQVIMHLDMEKANKALLALELEHDEWQAMEKAFDQRMKALSKLVDLYLKNYWAESGLTRDQDSMKSHNANLARNDMAAARRRRES